MSNKIISVILPVYNVEKYLNRSIENILNQSYKNYELIIIDDGSTDNSANICKEYLKSDSRIKYIYKDNGGLGSARNAGLEIATGDYIVFIDSDDYISQGYFQEIINIYANYDVDIICFGYFKHIGENINNIFALDIGLKQKEKIMELILTDKMGSQVPFNVYKRELWLNVKFPNTLYEDLYTTHLVFDNAKNIFRSEKSYYNYIIRNNSISTSINPFKSYDIFYGYLSRIEFIKNNSEYNYLNNEILKKSIIHGIQAMHSLVRKKEFKNKTDKVANKVLDILNELNETHFEKYKKEVILYLKNPNIYRFLVILFYTLKKGKL